MILQDLANLIELLKCLRELLAHLRDVHRSTNACYYVLALCIGQELTEQSLLTGSRVTCEGYAGTAVVAHVTECHGLYVNCRSPGIGDIVVTTVYVRTGVVPGTEYSLDCSHQLFLRIIREICADLLFIFCLELISQLLQVFCCQLYVLLNALLLLHSVNQLFEVLLSYFHYNVRVHLNKSPIAVPCPAGIAGFLCDCVYYGLVQTQVQNGVHHTRHGCTSAGTNGYQQRILRVTELLAGDLFHLADVLVDLSHDLIVDFLSVLVVLGAGLCCDSKALRYGESQTCHLCQICSLSTQKITHLRITFFE